MPADSAKSANGYVEPVNERQIQIYRRMTGEQRLKLGLDMIEAAWRAAADAVRRENPGISQKDLKARLRECRVSIYRHEAEFDLWHRLQRDAGP